MKKVFIDGSAGTTGLRIFDRLKYREDVELITLTEEKRKDIAARKEAINQADIVFLCLPDDAAREAVSLVKNENTVIIDASTAHRTLDGWAYGFPELGEAFAKKIASSKRIAVPGCHASGFIALVYPLIEAGMLDKDALVSCHSLTGYSGGGKSMIKEYNDPERGEKYRAPFQYATAQQHKHLKEMKAITGLENEPLFSPIVADFYSGMLVTVPIFKKQLKKGGIEEIKALYAEKYQSEFVCYEDIRSYEQAHGIKQGFVSATLMDDYDTMKIFVDGNEERMVLMAAYDNLGKGASGAAVECMNIVMGSEKNKGLIVTGKDKFEAYQSGKMVRHY